jgi:hypothetical protein
MEIVLTYEGRIPSKRTDLSAVWDMRTAFHHQLRKLWGKVPFDILKEWEDSNFAAQAPNFLKVVGDHTFVPLYGEKIRVGVDLDIRLLTGLPEKKNVITAGDLDNRIKRIIDALQAPTQPGEMLPNMPAIRRWHCLVENDSSVLALKATLGSYLGNDDPSVAFVTIVVRPIAMAVTFENLPMLL